jgi:hypothetical protein
VADLSPDAGVADAVAWLVGEVPPVIVAGLLASSLIQPPLHEVARDDVIAEWRVQSESQVRQFEDWIIAQQTRWSR